MSLVGREKAHKPGEDSAHLRPAFHRSASPQTRTGLPPARLEGQAPSCPRTTPSARIADAGMASKKIVRTPGIGGYQFCIAMTDEEREERFLEWQKEHSGILLKVARSFALSTSDQKDLIQEILIQLWLSLDRFQNHSKPSTWIYRVALNTAMGWSRGERRRRERFRKMIEMNAYWQEKSGPENEKLSWLYEAIHQLNSRDRSLILLYLDDLSYAEMAEIAGLSESNVGVRINRTKNKLAELWKKGGHS